MTTFSAVWSDELEVVLKLRTKEHKYLSRNGTVYHMSLVGKDIETVAAAVNQGIDSHLEACYIPERGDNYYGQDNFDNPVRGKSLECYVSPQSLVVLIRRLMESENGLDLASSICDTLDIELI